jgi:hypothetical protein
MQSPENISANVLPAFESPNAFKDALYSRLKGTGILNATKVSECFARLSSYASQMSPMAQSIQWDGDLVSKSDAVGSSGTAMHGATPCIWWALLSNLVSNTRAADPRVRQLLWVMLVHGRCQARGIARKKWVQSQLRKQLLEHLRQASPSPNAAPRKACSIQEQVLNTLFAEYLAATQRTCTLSVFLPEAALDEAVPLTHEDMMSILQIQPASAIYAPFRSALDAVKSASPERGADLKPLHGSDSIVQASLA